MRIYKSNVVDHILLCGQVSYVAQRDRAIVNSAFVHFLRHITNGLTFPNLAAVKADGVELAKERGWEAASTAQRIPFVMWRLDGP